MRFRRWSRALIPIAGLVAVAALLGGTWVVDRATPTPLRGGAPPEPLIVPTSHLTRTQSAAVSVKVVSAAGSPVRTAAGGTITDLRMAVGSALDDGAVVAAIDDLPVTAMVAPAPLYRNLGPGDKGADVERLQRWLGGLGYPTGGVDGTYGGGTATAVARFNKDHGRTGDTFDLAAVAWIGRTSPRIGTVAVSVGDQIAAGAELGRSDGRPVSITVTEPKSSLSGASAYKLVVGQAAVPYEPSKGQVSAEADVAAVAAALGAAVEGTGRIESANPVTVMSVPAGALVTDSEGKVCVFPDATAAPVPVTAMSSALGVVDIEPIDTLTSVLANPAQVRVRLSCAS